MLAWLAAIRTRAGPPIHQRHVPLTLSAGTIGAAFPPEGHGPLRTLHAQQEAESVEVASFDSRLVLTDRSGPATWPLELGVKPLTLRFGGMHGRWDRSCPKNRVPTSR